VHKNSNRSYVRNVLHIKLVKLQSVWKSGSGSGQICDFKRYWRINPAPAIRLRPDWKKINLVQP